MKCYFRLLTALILITGCSITVAQRGVQIDLSAEAALIENSRLRIEFDLKTGNYSGIDKSDNTMIFKDAWYRVGQGGWLEPEYHYKAEILDGNLDEFGEFKKLRVWYMPQDSYDPNRFIDIAVYNDQPFFVIGWGLHNNKEYTIRARSAEVLLNGILFEDQKCSEPRVLRGGAGAEPNFVESTWEIEAHNSAMLTYYDNLAVNRRRTIVAGGLEYAEFMRTVEYHKKAKGRRERVSKDSQVLKESFITLTIHDPQGIRIEPGETWISEDTYFVDIVTSDPFASLERFGQALAKANNANPNAYNFPTLCGWMTSQREYGDGTPTNNTPALVKQLEIADERGITSYTPVALRLEPDFYCYSKEGNTQQGWWDDEHWAKYGSFFKEPYETFSKFAKEINSKGGKVFTYFQVSMPSNDFALAHPEWILNDDISLLYEDHPHHKPFIRLDYTNPGFQEYMLKMWGRLKNDGVIGIKFDYPETGWARNGGFDNPDYSTVSAYRKVFGLCREGLGADAYIHERILGESEVPRTDCAAGLIDLQRVWGDASHFEPEMSSRIGLRWYKQGRVFRYYPDGKSFHQNGRELSQKQRRTFLTMIGLLSGRIELGTNFRKMTDDMIYDLTRLYPVLPNGKSFRPADMLLEKEHPEVYVYEVSDKWKQVILINNSLENTRRTGLRKTISTPLSGDMASKGSLGMDSEATYYVFDFWNQEAKGIIKGTEFLSDDLLAGEALVYSVRQAENHPMIIGTNRHIMCGMMDISDEEWDHDRKELRFVADLIGGETMNITIAIPERSRVRIAEVKSRKADISYESNGEYIVVSASSGENTKSSIKVSFK